MDKVAATLDTALNGAGFRFSLPGESKPSNQGGAIVGFYTKADSSDILLSAVDIPADPNQLAGDLIPGLSPATMQKFLAQVKGKKSLAVLIVAPGLLQAIFAGLSGASSGTGTGSGLPGSTKTAVPSPTTK